MAEPSMKLKTEPDYKDVEALKKCLNKMITGLCLALTALNELSDNFKDKGDANE